MVRRPAYRAVITGIGCVSPFGVGGYDLGAEIPAAYLPEVEEARRWSRLSHMTDLACRQAVAEAGLCDAAALCQAGLVVGSQFGDLRSTEAFCLGFLRKGPLGLSPLLFPSTVMNAMAGITSIALGLKGPMLTLNQSGVAGELAVARALALLRAGRASAVIACGVDELFPLLYETLVQLLVPSPRSRGEEVCWPFDHRHNGPILGEGATAVVLELPEHAQARGAPMLAEVRSAYWGGMPTRPGRFPVLRQGPYPVLDQALAEAAVCPEDVYMAYLSSCGDPQHDAMELACIADTFGPHGPLLTSVTH